MQRQRSIRTALTLILFSRIACVWGASPEALVGLSLEEGLNTLERDGLKLFFSSDLVRSSMRIDSAPSGTDAISIVTHMLEPHGLTLLRGLNDSWLVVRAPTSRVAMEAQSGTEAADIPIPAAAEQPIEELIVAASQYEISRSQTSLSQFIASQDIEHMPDIGDDVIRTVTRLPGIASNGFSALSHFRGGELSETLVRFDGLRLYDPFHLRDFQSVFSAIDPRIVSSMDVYTGGFPAVFGDRMSGVIDVESMTVEEDMYHEFGASFFNTSLLSAGQFADQRAEWVVSVRRSNLDILYDRFSNQPDRPRYADLYSRLRYDISDSLAVSANILRAEDTISLADDEDREEEASARQSDSYEWLRFDHSPGGRTSGATLLSRTRLESSRVNGTTAKQGVSTGRLDDLRSFTLTTLQTDWSRLIGARMLLDFGGSIVRMRGHYDYRDQVEYDLLFDIDGANSTPSRSREISARPHGRQYSLYSTLRVDWNPRIASEFGLRWNHQSLANLNESTIGPRLGFRYNLSERSTVRASWGRFYQSQAINELQVNDGIDQFFPPQQSDQLVIGFDRRLGGDAVLRIEAYEKSMRDLRPRYENFLNPRVLLPELKPDRIRIDPDTATARGLEITFNGSVGAFDWWSSLSLAEVTDTTRGVETDRSWDQTHSINAGFQWNTPTWILTTAVSWRTGWPISSVSGFDTIGTPVVRITERNNERLRAFGSLDVRLSREIAFDRSAISVFVEIANLTGRNNPCCLEYEVGDEEDSGQFVLDELGYLNTIPSIGFLWKF